MLLYRNVIEAAKSALILLPFIAFGICVFLIPHFYSQRIATGIFKTDFYLIWITGGLCWIHNVHDALNSVGRLVKVVIAGCVYVIILGILKSFPDENSINAVITLISSIGIVKCLNAIVNTKYSVVAIGAIMLGYFIQVYIGFNQAIESDWQSLSIKGELNNSGFFGNYLASLIPLLLSGFVSNSNLQKPFRLFFAVAFIALVALLTLTVARAGWIGSAVGCIIVVLFRVKRFSIKSWFIISGVAVLFILSAAIALYNLKPDSALGRTTIYKVSYKIIEDHPLFGVGPNRFAAVYNNYQSEYFQDQQIPIKTQLLAENTFEAFNLILQVLVEYGLVGLLILMVVTYLIAKDFIKSEKAANKSWLIYGSAGCMVSILVASLFSNPFHVTPVLIIFVFNVAVILPKRESFQVKVNLTMPLIFSIAFAISIFSYALIKHNAESKWYEASELAKFDSFISAKGKYEQAYHFLKSNGDFLYNYGAEASLSGDNELSIQLLQRAKQYSSFSNLYLYLADAYTSTNQYELAEENYLKAIYMVPSKIYPKYQLVRLYGKWGKTDQGIRCIDDVLQYPIKIKSRQAIALIEELKKLKELYLAKRTKGDSQTEIISNYSE